MLIRVLGSAAGGGFPQWNCGCDNCAGVRTGRVAAAPRTQECVAISPDRERWFLLNCSPEIRQQIESFPALHPRGRRHSPIAAILLTNGDLDHCLGLLSLRESHPLAVYATGRVRSGFTTDNVLYRTLERFPGQVAWRELALGKEVPLTDVEDRESGLSVEAVAVPGKLPVHLEAGAVAAAEDSVGFLIREPGTGKALAYLSGVGAITDAVRRAVADADCAFLDGTFWSSDELEALGLGTRRAEDMAHVPVGGPHGSLARLAGVGRSRRILIHLNNSNPLLREDSPERAQVEAAGWEIAWDGMEVHL